MKHPAALRPAARAGRAPLGARGLKPMHIVGMAPMPLSRPARGAWIETDTANLGGNREASRPARGAWIETKEGGALWTMMLVAPRSGRVD